MALTNSPSVISAMALGIGQIESTLRAVRPQGFLKTYESLQVIGYEPYGPYFSLVSIVNPFPVSSNTR